MIQQAGLAKCLAMGREKGRPNPERDLAVIKKAALWGYKTAAQVLGCSGPGVEQVVKKYSEYAALILAAQPEK